MWEAKDNTALHRNAARQASRWTRWGSKNERGIIFHPITIVNTHCGNRLMKRRTILNLLFFIVLLPALAWGEQFSVPHNGSPYRSVAELEDNQILHLPTGIVVTQKQMIDTVAGSRVIYIGETHDNLEAHRVQLDILRDLHARFPGKVAVGMEMFRRSAQPWLDDWHRGDLSAEDFRELFRRNWGAGYRLYLPITDFIRSKKIPLIGLKSTTETEQNLRDNGPEAPELPEIDFDDPYHRAYSMSLFGANKDHAPEVLRPYQMLLLWEESMAQTVSEFLQNPKYSGWKLVVLAGGFHVQYGYGIPKRAFRRTPHAYSIVLPTVTDMPDELKDREMNLDPVSIPLYSADFAWKVPYAVEEDDSIRLGVMLKENEEDGLLVTSVLPDSNAQRMGILSEDRLIEIDGQALDNIDDLRGVLQGKVPGDSTTMHVLRAGETLHLTIDLKKAP